MPERNPGSANLPIGARRRIQGKTAALESGAPKNLGWHSRGYLPHFESSCVIQHVTFRLADSLTQSALRRIDAELKSLAREKRNLERRERIEAWLDAGHGSCILREAYAAQIVQQSFLAFDRERYRLLAWVVMPNHVHVLFEPIQGWAVAKIVASWKKFTARKILEARSERGEPVSTVWQREYWDRYIRNERHLERAIEYIHMNPVKAALVAKSREWRWSSARWFGRSVNIGE